MSFGGFNTNDFSYFIGNRDSAIRETIKEKITELSSILYESIPNNIRKYLKKPHIGKFSVTSDSLWFSIRPIQYDGAENINYNFDICKKGLRYCLNAETMKAIKILKRPISNNRNEFLRLANIIDKNEIWVYERILSHRPSGSHMPGDPQEWKRIAYYNRTLNSEDLDNILTKISRLKHSAVRIGQFYNKDDATATSQQLPEYLVELTKTYYKLFKFLNNL
ncbi:hypothetical protein ACFLQS_00800 [Actinomycetota bacterium]